MGESFVRESVSTKRWDEVVREQKLLTEEQIAELLDPVKLTNLDRSQYPKPKQ